MFNRKLSKTLALVLAAALTATSSIAASAATTSRSEYAHGQNVSCSEIRVLPGGGKAYVYNIDGIENIFPVPPTGFQPLKATDEQLKQYGFPSRPTDTQNLNKWRDLMANYKYTPSPEVSTSNIIHGPFSKAGSGLREAIPSNSSSTNWSGYVAYASSSIYPQVEGDFVQPTIASNCLSDTYESTWVGLGGYNSGKLVQTGTSMNTYGGGRNYYAWYEYLSPSNPNPEIRLNSVTIRAGDRIHTYCSFQRANNVLNCYIANNTNGTSQSVIVNLPASEYFDGSSADFINEHPSVGGTDNGLTNYGVTNWTNCKAYLNTGSWVNLGTRAVDAITMVGSSNTLAQPSGLSGTNFRSTWYNYS